MYKELTDHLLSAQAHGMENYRLCYIEEIPSCVWGWSKSSLDELNRTGLTPEEYYSSPNAKYIHMIEVDNPAYVKGSREYLAYFVAPENLSGVTGEGWDMMGYEGNAERPFDSISGREIDVAIIPFAIGSPRIMLPKDWFCGDSTISVDEINTGALAWMSFPNGTETINVRTGDTVFEFEDKIRDIRKMCAASDE